MNLTAADHGTSLRAHIGDEIVVQIAENPTTGYRWHTHRIDGMIEHEADSHDRGSNTAPGAGGIREFRFRATATGTGRLELKHWREWEGDSSVTQRLAADITVVD